MKQFKSLFQVLVVLVMLFGVMGTGQLAQAQTSAVVVVRDLTYWDATYTGYVDANRFEKWPVVFDQTENFEVTATPTGDGLTTMIRLLDVDGVELASAAGKLTGSQPAGNYFVQVEPETGSGFYSLTIRRAGSPTLPTSTTTVDPSTVDVGGTATVSVSLDNIPEGGYTSAEFTCTYDAGVVEVSNIVVTDLFGADSASAITSPADGSFIVAVAGSNGNKATTDGVAFTFSATGLQEGTTTITCAARVSQGDGVLSPIDSISTDLTVGTIPPLCTNSVLNGSVLAGKAVTIGLYDADGVSVATTSADVDGNFSFSDICGTYKIIATADGFLGAAGIATVATGETITMSTVTLLAGDIDGNSVIDQFDAMTIGMSYNSADPAAADLNNDSVINVLDLELLAANYRATGPIDWP